MHNLMAHQRETEALANVAERLGWDQETMMPRGAAEQRGEEMAAMEGVLHARRTDPANRRLAGRSGTCRRGGAGADRVISAAALTAQPRCPAIWRRKSPA